MMLDNYNLSGDVAGALNVAIIARRQGVQTAAIGVPAARSVDVMTDLEAKITNKMVELFMLGEGTIIDLDSARSNVVRFYCQRLKTAHSAFPFNGGQPKNSKHIGIGFFFDTEANRVTQYKHYFIERETPTNLHNFKFTPDGTPIGSYFEQAYDGAEYADLAAGVDLNAWRIQYSRRTDTDQSYMIVKPKLEHPERL